MMEDQPWIPKDDVVLVDERGDLIVVRKASSCRAALDAQWLDREGATRSPPVDGSLVNPFTLFGRYRLGWCAACRKNDTCLIN